MQSLNQIICGDCLEVMKTFPEESIDLIVTDPPYGYSFMGKDWDRAVPSVDVWKECHRVLKAGAFAFVMSSPRQDVLSQMIIRLGQAGFETGFTSIYWCYACLSEDTEILTESGWKPFHSGWDHWHKNIFKSETPILCFDVQTEKYHFEKPTNWHTYGISDTLVRIKSTSTDQLVTRNHRVVVEREGKLLLIEAERLRTQEKVAVVENLCDLQETDFPRARIRKSTGCLLKELPRKIHCHFSQRTNNTIRENQESKARLSMLPEGVLDISCMASKGEESWSLLFNQLPSEGQHSQISPSEWEIHSQNVRKAERETARSHDGRKESSLERRGNLLQNSWQLCWSKICSLSTRILSYGTKRWLRYGASSFSGSRTQSVFAQVRGSSPYRPRPHEQCLRQLGIIPKQSNSQVARERKSYRITLATITKEHYEGLVFCPTVSTGCFVARRNGKIFLTGNSGFPKAMNISKMVDKRGGRPPDEYRAFATYIKQKREELGLGLKDVAQHFLSRTGGLTGCVWNWENGANVPTKKQMQILKEKLHLDNRFDELIERAEAEREVIGIDEQKGNIGFENQDYAFEPKTRLFTKPATSEAKVLDGSYGGFQPKPALEVILVCMKPLSEKTFVDQALANGKGVSWLDDARIPFSSEQDKKEGQSERETIAHPQSFYEGGFQNLDRSNRTDIKGRFPANLLVSDDALNDGRIIKNTYVKGDYQQNRNGDFLGGLGHSGDQGYDDHGSFSRYFDLDKWFAKTVENLPESVKKTFPFLICPKASKTERNQGCETLDSKFTTDNNKWSENDYRKGNGEKTTNPKKNFHPTVKPLKLMSYLVTLGSRPNDLVLDPFCGSGTTCLASEILSRKWIGIDNNPEYCEIARKRLSAIPKHLESFMNPS